MASGLDAIGLENTTTWIYTEDKSVVHDVAFTATDDDMRDELLQYYSRLSCPQPQMLYLASARTGRTLKLRPAIMMRLLRTVQSFGDLCEYCAQAKGVRHSPRKSLHVNLLSLVKEC